MAQATPLAPLLIQEQGSFAAGGTMTTAPGTFDPRKPMAPDGQTYRGDHAYAFYQIPVDARKLPIVMWHGAGQFSKTWETTADGREGFQTIFLRRRFGVYLDRSAASWRCRTQHGRGDRSSRRPDEQLWFNQFRIGLWPNYFDGVQFDRKPETLNQFFRAMTPNTGPFDMNVVSDGVSAVFDRIGPGILFTHSQGGGPGWLTAIKNGNVKAIVSFEPGSSFLFPQGEVPAADPECVRHRAGRCHAAAAVHGADADSDPDSLRRQHPRASRSTCRLRTAGAPVCRWPGYGATPSTAMAAT